MNNDPMNFSLYDLSYRFSGEGTVDRAQSLLSREPALSSNTGGTTHSRRATRWMLNLLSGGLLVSKA